MPIGAKVSCLATKFDERNKELIAFSNGFIQGRNMTVIEGVGMDENTIPIAKAFDFNERGLANDIITKIKKNSKNRLSLNGVLRRLEIAKSNVRTPEELDRIQRNIDSLRFNQQIRNNIDK